MTIGQFANRTILAAIIAGGGWAFVVHAHEVYHQPLYYSSMVDCMRFAGELKYLDECDKLSRARTMFSMEFDLKPTDDPWPTTNMLTGR